MWQENVEIVRQVIAAIRSDDWRQGSTRSSRTRTRESSSGRCSPTSKARPTEATTGSAATSAIGPDAVFAHVRVRGIGRGSGLTMKVRVAVAFVLSDGKLLRMHSYPTRAEAVKAAGLSEQ